MMQGKTSMAEKSFQKATQENPDFLQPYFSLARLYLSEKNEEKAIAQYEKLLATNPTYQETVASQLSAEEAA